MKLIVGLGNPGKEYENTRHNAGFSLVDFFLKEQGSVDSFKFEKKFNVQIAQIEVDKEKVFLVKPMTFMNLSGQAVRGITDYYKIEASDILVVLDDMDIPVGELRVRKDGRSGGHNGLQSIIDEMGSGEILRVKLGIGRPEHTATQHVLESFSDEEAKIFEKVLEKGSGVIEDFIRLGTLDNTSYSVV